MTLVGAAFWKHHAVKKLLFHAMCLCPVRNSSSSKTVSVSHDLDEFMKFAKRSVVLVGELFCRTSSLMISQPYYVCKPDC